MEGRLFFIPEKTLQEMLNYLSIKPYGEVFGLMQLVQGSVREVTDKEFVKKYTELTERPPQSPGMNPVNNPEKSDEDLQRPGKTPAKNKTRK